MDALPEFAPFPSSQVREALLPEQWTNALAAWATLTSAVLALSDNDLKDYLGTSGAISAVAYLDGAYAEVAAKGPRILGSSPAKATANLRLMRTLLVRLLTKGQLAGLGDWGLLADFARVDWANAGDVLALAWTTQTSSIETSLAVLKKNLIRLLDASLSGDLKAVEQILSRLNYLLQGATIAAAYFAAGDDFMDGIVSCYKVMNPPLRKVLLATGYLCLRGLLHSPEPKLGMLADRLYSLKVVADAHKAGPVSERDSYVVELVSATPILSQIKKVVESGNAPGTAALTSRIDALKTYQRLGGARSLRPARLKQKKALDKGKQVVDTADANHAELHAHKLSKVAEIQDLFPHLGSAFVCKCLDEYGEDVEQVVAHLLDSSLSSYLAGLDQSEQLPDNGFAQTHIETAPQSTFDPPYTPSALLPTRRNIHDDDDLDRLSTSVSKNLHFGKSNSRQTADSLLHDKSTAPSKAAIMSALAAFDADDDERDDTYDADDVGAAIDSTVNEVDGIGLGNGNEEALWRVYTENPGVFDRSNDVRSSTARAKLREETAMTDEAIEGWYIMLNRSPRLKRNLEARYSTFDGSQTKLASSRWSRPTENSDSEDTAGPSNGGRGRGGYRGRGRGGGRGGGSVSGSVGDAATQKARKNKEASKGSRANHSRRDAHAKKMARGG
ncbi:Activating signal cointegrator 1 complex subunit2 [Ceratocystis lukuohia]|uniref:Activating signal cointegrator 1 complex subunit2 n=1 Tax=Ceratocystis lukuohia TaxID=2019550 RepID=A0ABR4M9Y1_9PEZI